jgi:mannose-1-phosphate guanylyltransferase
MASMKRSPNGDHDEDPSFWAVIPAGGAGTRLWPLSRSARPKFLLPLLRDRSLLQQTVDRLTPLAPLSRTLVVCGGGHAVAIARQLPGLPEEQILVEPRPRGTGPAIALAAAVIARRAPDAIMGSFAADHDVRDEAAFRQAVRAAMTAASDGWLVTIGLTPTRPETGYGYIERTDQVIASHDGDDVYRAARFVEKPDLVRATEYVASGRYLWNASMFIWRVDTFLSELARLQPAIHAGVTRIAAAWDGPEQQHALTEIWPTLPDVTIDNGVMELADRVAVVPAAMGWSDVGDWHGLGELIAPDEFGNSVHGDLVAAGSANSVVWSETDRIISLIGLESVIIVDTPDALLVADRRQAQEVRTAVARLHELNRGEHL